MGYVGHYLVPGLRHHAEHLASLFGDEIIFPRWSLGRFLSFVIKFTLLAETVEKGVERTFHHNQVCRAQTADYI